MSLRKLASIETVKSGERPWLSGVSLLALMLTAGLFSGCSAKTLDKSSDTPAKAQDITLTRAYQKVTYYDCRGYVTDQRDETVESPKEYVEIKPRSERSFSSANFRNLTTGSSPSCMVSKTKFNIDMAPTVCNMEVREGLNEIQYEFLYCDRPRSVADPVTNSMCWGDTYVGERGSVFIYVKYRQEMRESRNVYASNCP